MVSLLVDSTLGLHVGISSIPFSGVGCKYRIAFVGDTLGLFDGPTDGSLKGFTDGIVEGRFEGFGKLLGADVGVRVLLGSAFVITYTAPTLLKAYVAHISKSRYVSLL
jgi:hypothetical protein